MSRWLLLVHQLPPQPPYLRAKIAQRLARVGALALKNSVYVLPQRAETREDFDWILKEAVEGGGQAWIANVGWVAGVSDEELRAAFRAQADAEYEELEAELRAALAGREPGALEARGELQPLLAEFRSRLERAAARDFFGAAAGTRMERLLRSLAQEGRVGAPRSRRREHAELRGKVWVTRRGVFVDRIAAAWLVRRFIDPRARFRFVAGGRAAPRPGEIRFDMAEAEITHEGGRCTFEVLLDRLGRKDAALRRLAEIVHDIDLKDEKHGHPETAGLERFLNGLAATEPRDERRLEKGFAVLDGLYHGLAAPRAKRRKTK